MNSSLVYPLEKENVSFIMLRFIGRSCDNSGREIMSIKMTWWSVDR